MRKLLQTTSLSLLLCSVVPPADAAYVASIEQVGSDVVTTGSGSIDTAGLALFPGGNTSSVGGVMVAAAAELNLGSLSTGDAGIYRGIHGPLSFGSGGEVQASSGAGALVAMVGGGTDMLLPPDYLSGTVLGTSTDTYLNETLAGLGLTPGFYEWTWGSGATADSFSIQIGPAAVDGSVPEPASIALLFAGAVAGLSTRRFVCASGRSRGAHDLP